MGWQSLSEVEQWYALGHGPALLSKHQQRSQAEQLHLGGLLMARFGILAREELPVRLIMIENQMIRQLFEFDLVPDDKKENIISIIHPLIDSEARNYYQ